MGKYKLYISPAAKRDLQDLIDYTYEQGSLDQIKLYDDIIDRISSLAEQPFLHAFIKNPLLRLKGYRILAMPAYLVFYVVVDDGIQIRRILHENRQFERFLV